MKSYGNCGYNAVISQILPKYFGGNILGPGKDIPEYAKKLIYEMRGGKIIIVIDYIFYLFIYFSGNLLRVL
jgi:hypothetical protein